MNYEKVMKEIDFLPEWYKSGRRRQLSYRTQYIALGGVFVVMMVWNFSAAHTISKAKAKYAQMATEQTRAEVVSAKLAALQSELRVFQKKAESMKEIDSKIDVASVIAEISFLVDENIVLSKIEFISEKFADKRKTKLFPNTGAVVRAIPGRLNGRKLPLGDVRFKVVVSGVAADASDVAALICKLEDSPYFSQVVPSFSRNTEIKRLSGSSFNPRIDLIEESEEVEWSNRGEKENIRVSEFEIVCYLANYREL
jgi:hypothetical protein